LAEISNKNFVMRMNQAYPSHHLVYS